ncbi:MAG: DUF99 family protein [Candidatus Thermoplasmatota archaeon]|nr:DUF99 family protein [Candidatus Thermoplasmatota archaeon]
MTVFLKNEARVMGVDDGPYRRGSEKTRIIMTVMRMNGMIEGFLGGSIGTDGNDSSRVIAKILEGSRFMDQVRCIISDGACLGGFNVLDMDDLYERVCIPVITASDKRPDPNLMERTLIDLFPDGKERYKMISNHTPHVLNLRDGTCYIREEGITREEAFNIIERCTFQGRTPEPIRISHMIASLTAEGSEENG